MGLEVRSASPAASTACARRGLQLVAEVADLLEAGRCGAESVPASCARTSARSTGSSDWGAASTLLTVRPGCDEGAHHSPPRRIAGSTFRLTGLR